VVVYIIVSGMHGQTNIKDAIFCDVDEQFNLIKFHGINNVELVAVFSVSTDINTPSETRMVCELGIFRNLSIPYTHLVDFHY